MDNSQIPTSNPPKNNPPIHHQQPTTDKTDNQEKPTNPLPQNTKEPNNSPSPSVSDIQNQYNSDKDKSIIDNNSNLIQEEKQQSEELLKMIIAAEFLVKDNKLDLEILAKLLRNKETNTLLYQVLNKNGRIDKAISRMEALKRTNNSAVNSRPNKPNKNSFSQEIIWAGIFLVVVGVGLVFLIKKKKGFKPSKKSV